MEGTVKSVEPHEILHLLRQRKKLIFLSGLFLFALAMLYGAFKPPRYRTNVLLQVHHQKDNSLGSIGSAGNVPAADSLSNEPITVQISLIRSRYILGPVIQSFSEAQHFHPAKNSLFGQEKDLRSESLSVSRLNAHLDARDLTGFSENNPGKPAVLQLSLTGGQPDEIIWLINKIAQITKQRDVERKSLQAKKTLDFLTRQLVDVQESLKKAEKKFNQYRASSGSIDVKVQTQNLLAQLSGTDKDIEAAHLEKSALLRTYTSLHPAVVAVTQKEKELQAQRADTYRRVKKINEMDQMLDSLEHDVQVKNNLYLTLLNKIHMQQMVAAGIVSDIDILSPATYAEAVQPVRLSTLGVAAFLTGILLAGLAVIVRRLLSLNSGLPHALLMTHAVPEDAEIFVHKKGHGVQGMNIGNVAE